MADILQHKFAFWHKRLKSVPNIAHSYFYFIVKQKSPVRQSIDRGYKFFSESYIREIEGKCSNLPVNNFKTRDFDRNSKLALMLNVGIFSAAVVLENDFWDFISA